MSMKMTVFINVIVCLLSIKGAMAKLIVHTHLAFSDTDGTYYLAIPFVTPYTVTSPFHLPLSLLTPFSFPFSRLLPWCNLYPHGICLSAPGWAGTLASKLCFLYRFEIVFASGKFLCLAYATWVHKFRFCLFVVLLTCFTGLLFWVSARSAGIVKFHFG
jgi:hypothetical protein